MYVTVTQKKAISSVWFKFYLANVTSPCIHCVGRSSLAHYQPSFMSSLPCWQIMGQWVVQHTTDKCNPPINVIQYYWKALYLTFPYMSARILNGWVAVYIGQLPQAKSIWVVARICEAIYDYDICLTVEHLPYPAVELIIRNISPVERFLEQTCYFIHIFMSSKHTTTFI